MIVNIPRPKIRLFGIVRDATGKPKFDDPHNVPPEIVATLTDQDLLLMTDFEIRAMNLETRLAAIRKG